MRGGVSGLALPKGGGALSGLGESFAPDLHTGTGNFTVPLALPDGRHGLQPALSLVYSSGHGNGPFGLGWDVGVPGIARKTAAGIPLYRESDVFMLSEDLVRLSETPEGTLYRPRTEGTFCRILRRRDGGVETWQVTGRDGLVSRYGEALAPGGDPAVIADPDDRGRIFAWRLTSTTDPFGNRIVYRYARDTGAEGPRRFDQLYLRQVQYVDHDAAPGFLVSVELDYGADTDRRPDPFSDYRAGFEIRTRRRCRAILVRTHAGEDRLVRSYRLTYLDERVAAGDLDPALVPPNRVSLLSRIQVTGHDGEASETMPPLDLEYSRFRPEKRRFSALGGSIPARSLAAPQVDMVDLRGKGLPDIVEVNGHVRYWSNLGEGRFAPPRIMTEAPAGLDLANAGVQFLDADGDGRMDLVVSAPPVAGYYPLAHSGGWDRKSFRAWEQAPSFPLDDPEVRLVDLDGDGVTDAIRSGSRLECFFSDAEKGWSRTRLVERRPLEDFPNVSFSDPRVRWADMSGDGLQDIALVHGGSVVFWPSLGHGRWGKRIQMRNPPRLPADHDPKRLLLGDVDGDGVADLVYVDNRRVLLWINAGGERWSDPVEIRGVPTLRGNDDVRLVDLLGSGTPGVLWTRDAAEASADRAFFLDFCGGEKPYLLRAMDNHMGARTTVAYAPSTTFFLKDERAAATRWRTSLPLPVQVVAKVEVIDAVSRAKSTTEYRYRHGHWDGAEREFRGFGMVETLDSQVFEDFHADDGGGPSPFLPVAREVFAPPVLTRTWFHQGPMGEASGDWRELDHRASFWPGDPPLLDAVDPVPAFLAAFPQAPASRRAKRDALRTLRGSVLRSESYALDGSEREGRPFSVAETVYGLREEAAAGGESRRVFFPHVVASRATTWERGDDPMTTFNFVGDYDAFGQARRTTVVEPPRRSARRRRVELAGHGDFAPDQTRILASHSRSTFATPDPGVHLFDRPAEASVFELVAPPEVIETAPDDLAAVLREQLRAAVAVRDRFEAGAPGDVRLAGYMAHRYDGPAFVGLEVGRAGRFGALSRTAVLMMTDAELDAAWGAARPAYLDGPAPLPAGAPAGFGADHGYERIVGPDGGRRYFGVRERRLHDFQAPGAIGGRGLVLATLDPLGHRTDVTFDAFAWLPVEVRDPLGLSTRVEQDYRVLQPRSVTDANGNVSAFAYSPLGLLTEGWARGKPERTEGDRTRPSVTFQADFFAFERDGSPVCLTTRRRAFHDTDLQAPPAERDRVYESREYSDGFGRIVQVRSRAEPLAYGLDGQEVGIDAMPGTPSGVATPQAVAERVVVSAWQAFDNKGRPVRTWEAFFDAGWTFQPDAMRGPATRYFYDAGGALVRTVGPDGTEVRTVRGVPLSLETPDQFAPTPWEAFAYDPNDLGSVSRDEGGSSLAGRAPAAHHFTPVSSVVDARGRVLCRIDRLGPDPAADWRATRSRYDGRDNLVAVIDAAGREAMTARYDLAGATLQVTSLDGGVRRHLFNAAGDTLQAEDSKGSCRLKAFDAAGRLTRVWARDDAAAPLTVREEILYGETGDAAVDRAANRLGMPRLHYDEAGRVSFDAYSFKGAVLAQTRRTVRDEVLTETWSADWAQAGRDAVLDPREYRTDVVLDAADKVRAIVYPADTFGARARLTVGYDQALEVTRLQLDGQEFVSQIAYDARGRRVLIAYGNGAVRRHRYDARSGRLLRQHVQVCTSRPDGSFQPAGPVLHDIGYDYDLAGNVTGVRRRFPGAGVENTPLGADALDCAFGYDPMYQLTSATGRETDLPPNGPLWEDVPRSVDRTRARPFQQTYVYDLAGNMTRLTHRHIRADGSADVRVRTHVPVAGGNRLASAELSGVPATAYQHDPNGNTVREATSRHFGWSHLDQLQAFRVQAGAGPASLTARYLYASEGGRVKKVVRTQGEVRTTTYVDGIFEHHRRGATEHCLLHVLEGESRIALVRRGPAFDDDGAADTPVQYVLDDYTGGSQLMLGGADATSRAVARREEFTPFGETCFGSFARKRYRLAGKERDEESGLYAFGARYYAPWLARWWSCDPGGLADGPNLYLYCQNNPVTVQDPDGEAGRPKVQLRVMEFGKKDATGKVTKKGFSKTVVVPKPATTTAAQAKPPAGGAPGGGVKSSAQHGHGAGGKDTINQAGVKGAKDGAAGGTGTGAGGGTGGGGGGTAGGGDQGSATGSPTGSANSRGGSPNGTDDPNLKRHASGESGTGITGKGTGSLTQLDLAVLIAGTVADPTQAAIEGMGEHKPEAGKSGGVPEGGSMAHAGSELIQSLYVAAKVVAAAASLGMAQAFSGGKAAAKSAAKKALAKLPKGNAISVLAEVPLPKLTKFRVRSKAQARQEHIEKAYEEIFKRVNGTKTTPPDHALRDAIHDLYKRGDSLHIHHSSVKGNEGVLQLIPGSQHTGEIFQDLLHPKFFGMRAGGFFHWGMLY